MFYPCLVYRAVEKVKLIRDRLKAVQSHQKSYADVRHRELDFEVGDKVFIKVSPMKGVLRFGKKGKLSPRFVGPYAILRKVSNIAYTLELPSCFSSIYPVFHVYMLRKHLGDLSLMVPLEGLVISILYLMKRSRLKY